MSFNFTSKYLNQFVTKSDLESVSKKAEEAKALVYNHQGPGGDFLGWVNLPFDYDKEEFERILYAAEKIKKICDVFVVIGIGGSYLGARAAIEFVNGQNYNLFNKGPKVFFVGNDISSSHMKEVLEYCKDKDVCVNVISKSGTTTEPAIAFRVFKELLEKKYGESAKERIFATTDKSKGALRFLSDKNGYETFVVPDDIGGRFSVLSAVGLLPIAVAGLDIKEMMKGAADAATKYKPGDVFTNECMQYAAIRNILFNKGKSVEILSANEPALTLFCEWWKQLCGESEGKDNKGLFPASTIYSTDLHSVGQFIQEGSRIMFETVLNVNEENDDLLIKHDDDNLDGMNYLEGKSFNFVKEKAFLGTVLAHTDGDVPNNVIEITSRTPYDFGYLVYFFEMTIAISGYMLGINPFNQPGVEAYKKNMFALLGKPGYETQKEILEKRVKELD